MKKKLAAIIAILLVIAIVIGITVSNLRFRGDLTEISSEKQLQKIVDGYNYSGDSTVLAIFICPLIALPTRSFSGGIIEDASSSQSSGGGIVPSEITSSASDTKSFEVKLLIEWYDKELTNRSMEYLLLSSNEVNIDE